VTAELDDAFAAAAAALEAAERIVALGHVGPDGDALGSALGLALAARAVGKEAWASFGEPFWVPRQFRYLEQAPLVPPGELTGPYDVVVACDTAAPERLGSALPVARGARTLIVVDHHLSNGGFGDVLVIDPGAAATAQLVYPLLERLGWPIGEGVAMALYTGLVTDTGRFQYSATTAEVHRVAARLLEAGAVPEIVGRHVYEEAPFGYLEVVGAVLSRAEIDAEARLVWSQLFAADLEAAGVRYEDTDGLIDVLRLAEEADVACLLKELEPGVLKGSLRSRGRVDVAAVAAAFGGGGHHNAAGFTAHGEAADVIAQIRAGVS
jgi:phosphoesterase RecJ-like protein